MPQLRHVTCALPDIFVVQALLLEVANGVHLVSIPPRCTRKSLLWHAQYCKTLVQFQKSTTLPKRMRRLLVQRRTSAWGMFNLVQRTLYFTYLTILFLRQSTTITTTLCLHGSCRQVLTLNQSILNTPHASIVPRVDNHHRFKTDALTVFRDNMEARRAACVAIVPRANTRYPPGKLHVHRAQWGRAHYKQGAQGHAINARLAALHSREVHATIAQPEGINRKRARPGATLAMM